MIVNIDKKIKEWKSEAESADDYMYGLANNLLEFKTITNLEKYISDDAENYYDTDCYKQLLESIAEIIHPEIEIFDITAINWMFKFKINGKEVEIKMKDPETDWLQEEFIDQLNELIGTTQTSKKLEKVYATSESNADQCFDLCFISKKTLNLLINNEPRYAFNSADYN
ncbi:MAG: hypothetical protein LBE34_02950 [Flavobacteriaceae bacterium]|jgi:hypothetical protein|nr:hypothetical protein [Flavobacteriaceae bacterium]